MKSVFEQDLNSIDLSKPFTETHSFIDENGESITTELSFEPSPFQTYGSSTNPASPGTWTSRYTGAGGTVTMSYKFDLIKSGSQWKMSNAREHSYSGLFCTFNNPKLYISRAASTSTFPAEINASVGVKLFDNSWVPLGSTVWIMSTTVNSAGTMKLTWN